MSGHDIEAGAGYWGVRILPQRLELRIKDQNPTTEAAVFHFVIELVPTILCF